MADGGGPIELPKDWSETAKSGLITAVGLARRAMLEIVSGFLNGSHPARTVARIAELELEIEQLREELRLHRSRLSRVEPRRRPHYTPEERLAILNLRAARGWTTELTAERFLVTVATIAAWFVRRDDQGDRTLLQTRTPVNRFPDFVGEVVTALKATVPLFGTQRIADVLARCGLDVSRTTIRRLLEEKKHRPAPPSRSTPEAPAPKSNPRADGPKVTANRAHHVWHTDLTFVPTWAGLWVPWAWFSSPLFWPFGFWVGAVLDHHTRAVVATRAWKRRPDAGEVVKLLDDARRAAQTAPAHIISDQGAEFQGAYLDWCAKHKVRARFGAVHQHGSIAVIERFWLSMKEECFRQIFVPLEARLFRRELTLYVTWYNEHRPHRALGGDTPAERLAAPKHTPARAKPRLEPRPKMPLARAAPGQRPAKRVAHLELVVDRKLGCAELPIVHLRATLHHAA